MAQAVVCAHCHQPVHGDDRFCGACGKQLAADNNTVIMAAAASKPPSRVATADAELLQTLREATAGEYEVYGELGRGGMAVVYLAQDFALDRKVAIKVLLPALLHSEGMAERFKNEARTAAHLTHVNIIPIFAVRETERIVFFVMKFVAGKPLDDLLAQIDGPMPIPMALAILWQIGRALGHAHHEGVFHRDVKPANTLIDLDGSAIVMDFGIAKRTDMRGMTMTGTTMGTPYYMSPEQCKSETLTAAADQYSLGIMAYEMIAGAVPFKGGSAMETMSMNCYDEVPSLAAARPDCPAEVVSAVHRMLAKKAEDRFETVEDALDAMGAKPFTRNQPERKQLAELLRDGSEELLSRVKTPSTHGTASATPWPASGPGLRTIRSGPQVSGKKKSGGKGGRIAAGIAVLAAVGGLGGWLATRGGSPPPPPALPGVVTIADLPPAGALAINGAPQNGTTFTLDAGSYVFRLTVPGFLAAVETVTVAGNDTTRLSWLANAVPETQTVIVRGLPAGGLVRLDDAVQPDTIFVATVGRHTVRMSADGLSEDVQQVDVRSGTTVAINFVRTPRPLNEGTLLIRNLPANGTVLVNGTRRQGTRFNLPSGTYDVELTAPGFRPDNARVRVVQGQVADASFSRRADDRPGTLQLLISPGTAELFVDGLSQGEGSQQEVSLTPGVQHLLRVQRQGYVTKDTTVVLDPGVTIRVGITLTRGSF